MFQGDTLQVCVWVEEKWGSRGGVGGGQCLQDN